MSYRKDIHDPSTIDDEEDITTLVTQGTPGESLKRASSAHSSESRENEEVIPLDTEDFVIISEVPEKSSGHGVSYAPVVRISSSAPSEPIDPYIGKQILGRYEIQSIIGVGGMGRVYKAYQNTVDRFVAIKILPSSSGFDEQLAKRFHLEALAASRLSHPNTIIVHDFGQIEDGSLCIVMEYLTGQTLESVIAERPNAARVLRITLQICGSLAEAHQNGIIHRDLKPPNIIVSAIGDDKDWVKVVDFGIAKLIDTSLSLSVAGTVSGTPEYMSPEQVQGEAVDARSDIYSLGLLLYELLTGRPVVQCNTPMACMYAHLHNRPVPFSRVKPNHPVSVGLESVVMKMLAKKPKDRFQSISELMPILSDFLIEEVTKRKSNPPGNVGSLNSLLPPKTSVKFSSQSGRSTPAPTDEIYMLENLAKLYEERGEPLQATDAYRKIACIHMDDNAYEDAARVLKAALALSPNDDAARRMIEACFAILEQRGIAGQMRLSPPPPRPDPALSTLPDASEQDVLARTLKQTVREGRFQQALSLIRTTLAENPKDDVAIEYAEHIYETVGDNVLDQDEVIWLKALLGTVSDTSSKSSSKSMQDKTEDAHCLVEIDGGKLESVFGGTYDVPRFKMQKHPVTNAEYRAFIRATGELPPSHWLGNEPPSNMLDTPVVNITINEARSYAEWCGMRLPNTVEWEAAARLPDGRQFPWGDDWESEYCHCKQNGATSPGPVGKYPKGASHFGCLDLLGNVWEWTEHHEGMTPPEAGNYWVLGGSFKHPCVKNGNIARTDVSENGAYPYLGFRCVRDVQRKQK